MQNGKMLLPGRFKSKKMKKIYYSIFTALICIVVFCTVYALILPAITLTSSNDTAKPVTTSTLSYKMHSNPKKSYRAYLEYTLEKEYLDQTKASAIIRNGKLKNKTSGILRQSVFYVYAYAGETLCLGSDVTQSLINADGYVQKAPTGVDILVTGPDGTQYTFDNDSDTGVGYISTVEQERSGANYAGSKNNSGYKPHEFLVRNTGIYEVRFHSYSGTYYQTCGTNQTIPHLNQSVGNGEPLYKRIINDSGNDVDDWSDSGCTIGAFDITVVSNGRVQCGRTYADYLSFNMGFNFTGTNIGKPSFYGDFYMVTDDGYIYHSTYNIDPFGFILFGNNRGIIDERTGYSAYQSVRAYSQDSNAEMVFSEDGNSMDYSVHNPQNKDTNLDNTYMVFVEMPDEALEGVLYNKAYAPERINKLEFVGAKENNVTYVENGGYFKFDVHSAVSVVIDLSFEQYNLQNGTDYGNIKIRANVVEGTNYIYWDGKDDKGDTIPAGWYKDDTMQVTIRAHAGEFHFPLLDVENASGVTFERVNRIWSYQGGELIDVTDDEDYENTKYNVFYNNTTQADRRNSPTGAIIADGKDMSEGVDSRNSVMSYGGSRGDYSILDVWTYAVDSSKTEIEANIVIEDLSNYKVANLQGLTFFDKNKDKQYNVPSGDFNLENVNTSIDYHYCESRWTVDTDPEDESIITALNPVGHIADSSEGAEERVDYYYHKYLVRRGADGQYYLYQYADNDRLHTGTPQPTLDKNGDPVTVEITVLQKYSEVAGTVLPTYKVWIPIHRESVTSVLGEYYYSGIMVDEDFVNIPEFEIPESVDDITITIENPNDDVYQVTTGNTSTGDFGTNGTLVQTLHFSDIVEKMRNSNTNKVSYYYNVADVGLYYDTYSANLTLVKRWGTINDSNDVQEITFLLEGYYKDGDTTVSCYNKEITVDYHSWRKTLTDLPRTDEDGNVLSYRVLSERYVKGSSTTYCYTYDWDSDDPGGRYEIITTDDNDNEVRTLLQEDDYPYQTYISDLRSYITGDEIYVENWTKATTTIFINKYGANDNVTKLANATFKLQCYNEATDAYEDIRTATGIYAVTTNKNGEAVFRGLSEGRYRLLETVPPENYDAASPIYFTVSKDTDSGNPDVKGTYKDGYSVVVYDNLSEAPVSKILKLNQYGDAISGAEFSIYPADSSFNRMTEDPVLVLTTDDDGVAIFEYERRDHSVREMYVSELKEKLGDTDNFILVESKVPDGYRVMADAHMTIVGKGMASHIVCANTFESAVWAKPNANVYATENLQIKNPGDYHKIQSAPNVNSDGVIKYTQHSANGQVSGNGTLFAVVLKRNGAEPDVGDLRSVTGEGWAPVYGEDINGYHVITDYNDTTAAVIECIRKGGATAFEPSADKTSMHAYLDDFPGYATSYYSYYLRNNMASVWDEDKNAYVEPMYMLAYYYTTASSLASANAYNTVQVIADGFNDSAAPFQIYWSTIIEVPDVMNILYVQKRDKKDNLVNNAVFALYDAVADADGNGYFIARDAADNEYYVRLDEDDSMGATVYTGTIDADDVLTITSSGQRGTYTVNTDGCSRVSRFTDAEIFAVHGRIDNDSAGTTTVTVGDSTYTIVPTRDAEGNNVVSFTHDTCRRYSEPGSAHLEQMYGGQYLLREIYAPKGFRLNYTNVEVVVGNREVYANAGAVDDGVRVGNGVGYVLPTLSEFASIGDIDETLSYVVATYRLKNDPGDSDGFIDISDSGSWPYMWLDPNNMSKYMFIGDEPTGAINTPEGRASAIYLRYNGSANSESETLDKHTLFDYTINESAYASSSNVVDSDALAYWTESGWGRIAIFQHPTAYNASNVETEYTDITLTPGGRENDISRLFSNSTFISYQDECNITLKVHKVSMTTNEDIPGAGFAFYKIEDDVRYYYSRTGNAPPEWKPLADGEDATDYCMSSDALGEIYYDSLEAGTYYLEELVIPKGYYPIGANVVINVSGGQITAYKEGTGTPYHVIEPDRVSANGNYVFTVELSNSTGYELPMTGGPGSAGYYAFGTLLLTAGAFMWGYKLRRKNERRAVD